MTGPNAGRRSGSRPAKYGFRGPFYAETAMQFAGAADNCWVTVLVLPEDRKGNNARRRQLLPRLCRSCSRGTRHGRNRPTASKFACLSSRRLIAEPDPEGSLAPALKSAVPRACRASSFLQADRMEHALQRGVASAEPVASDERDQSEDQQESALPLSGLRRRNHVQVRRAIGVSSCRTRVLRILTMPSAGRLASRRASLISE